MSPDASRVLKEAAPRPQLPLDTAVIARRAGRLKRGRRATFIVSVVAVVVATVAFVVTAPWERSSRQAPVTRPGHDDKGGREIPDGPRYVIASGRFDDGNWGEYQGKEWRLVAWGQHPDGFDVGTHCMQFWIERIVSGSEGTYCTEWKAKDVFGGRAYDPGGHGVPSISYGQVRGDVARLEFRLSNGEVVTKDPLPPPEELSVPVRYYVAFLPLTEQGEIVAFGQYGDELGRVRLCHGSCDGSHRGVDESERAAIEEYERSELPMDSRAAVFAVRAVAAAGLLDPLGDFYALKETIERADSWVVKFRPSICYQTAKVETCRENGPGSVEVTVAGDRLVVRSVRVPMDAGQRHELLSYSEPLVEEVYDWEFPYIRVDPQEEGWGVRTSPLWTGPMPPPIPDYGSICRLIAFDAKGKVVYRDERRHPMEVRGERFRAAGVLVTGTPPTTQPVASAIFSCSKPGPLSARW